MKKKTKSVVKAKSKVQAKAMPMSKSLQPKSAMASAMMTSKSMKETEQQMTPFSMLSILFVLYFIAQSIIVYLAAMAFPNVIVLGNNVVSPMLALLYSMGVLAVLVTAAMPIIEMTAKAFSVKLGDMHWMLLYLVINFVGLWTVARFAEVLGLGVASWLVVAALAFIINAAQGLITTQVMGWMKK